MKTYKIPEATIVRLSVYSRYLHQLLEQSVNTISSEELAKGVGAGSAQVRKDLAYFGEFGIRGVGYKVEELYIQLIKILGLNRQWNIIIIGAGKLGSALALYKGFTNRGFIVKAVLDIDPHTIGNRLGDVVVEPLELLPEKVINEIINIGVITVPAIVAQDITNQLLKAGVKTILNFSPQTLNVPNDVILRNVDLSVNLEVLSFLMSSK